jgi:hypothetical protein
MPLAYTSSGIVLIGNGEEAGTWGTITNNNLEIVNRLISEAGVISLAGTTHTLSIADGTLSEGQYAVLVFGGAPSGTNTVTINPNDAKRVFVVANNSGESVILTQGSGGNVTVANGDKAVVYSDGAGAVAAVVDVTPLKATLAAIGSLTPTDGNFIVGNGSTWVAESGNTVLQSVGVTATTTELNFVDGVTSNIQTQLGTKADTATTITAGAGLTGGGDLSTNRTISHADTSSQASVDNSGATVIQDVTLDTYGHVTGLASHTLTLANLGVTASATEVNYTTGVTSGIQTQLNAKANLSGAGFTGNLSITSDNPTISFIDTDHTNFSVHVNTNQWYVLNSGGAGILITDQSGNLTAAGNITAYSDERLKADITPIENALAKVMSLGGYTYTRTDINQRQTGVLAQEVLKVLPEAVGGSEETNYTVAYGNMIGLLIEAIKEQQAQIDELTARLES